MPEEEKTKSVVRAGGAKTPYAGPIHYAGPHGASVRNRSSPRPKNKPDHRLIEPWMRVSKTFLEKNNLK